MNRPKTLSATPADELDRLQLALSLSGCTKRVLLEQAGVNYDRFAQIIRGRIALRAKELIALASLFREYEYWILTGRTLPACGQVSPFLDGSVRLASKR